MDDGACVRCVCCRCHSTQMEASGSLVGSVCSFHLMWGCWGLNSGGGRLYPLSVSPTPSFLFSVSSSLLRKKNAFGGYKIMCLILHKQETQIKLISNLALKVLFLMVTYFVIFIWFSLCSLGCSGTHCLIQSGLKLMETFQGLRFCTDSLYETVTVNFVSLHVLGTYVLAMGISTPFCIHTFISAIH